MKDQKKILIVEDEVSLLKVLSVKFEKEKFEVLTARNGQEGLEIALQNKPDLILLDIVMPVMDGLTMLHKLRTNKGMENIPVIILTNLSDAEKVYRSHEENVFDYLVKSDWNINDVVAKVRQRLIK